MKSLIIILLFLAACSSNRVFETTTGKGLKSDPTPYGVRPNGVTFMDYFIDFERPDNPLTNQYGIVTFSGANVINIPTNGMVKFIDQSIKFASPSSNVYFDLECVTGGNVEYIYLGNFIKEVKITGDCLLDNLSFSM